MQNNASGAGKALDDIAEELSPETIKQQILAADDRVTTINKDVDGAVTSIVHESATVGSTLTRTFSYPSAVQIVITEVVS